MSLLKDFLIENANITDKEIDVSVSKRFKGKDGKPLKFKIKPVSGEQFSDYQKRCSSIEFSNRKRTMQLDSGKFNNMIIINHCVDPDFKDAELIKSVGVQTAEQALQKLLLAGEIVELSQQISAISGFDEDINEEIDNAKN